MQVNNLKPLGQPPSDAADADQKARLDAARKFEAVLMQQLLQVMRSTAKSGGMGSSEGASGQYLSMFDEIIATQMAEGGGIGLAKTIAEGLGVEEGKQALPAAGGALHSLRGGLEASVAAQPAITPPLPGLRGATSRLAQAAYAISAPEGGRQWAREGTLTSRDLASPLAATGADGDTKRFSVGFRDSYKCNLFAFEAARRAGFEVPVLARAHGLGFPTSNVVTAEAQAGQLRGDWAEVVPRERIGQLKGMLERGELGLMLTGSGADGRAGHMAVVERIHRIDTDAHGEVSRIEFDGYEARAEGAQHLTRRAWNRQGNGEDTRGARNGFGAIELLALRRAEASQAPGITAATRPAAAAGPSK